MARKPTLQGNLGQYRGETLGAMDVQRQVALTQAAQEQAIRPTLQYQQSQALRTQADAMLGTYESLLPRSLAAQGNYMSGMMNMLGPAGAQATEQYMGALPGQARTLSNLLYDRAIGDFNLGGQLSAQDTSYYQQLARKAAAARGLTGNQGVAMEVLGGYKLSKERLAEREAAAINAYNRGVNQQAQGYNMFLSPALSSSNLFGLSGLMNTAATGYSSLGQGFLQPESQYLTNIGNSNMQLYQAQLAAEAQKKSAVTGGLTSLFGNIVGAGIGAYGKIEAARLGQPT